MKLPYKHTWDGEFHVWSDGAYNRFEMNFDGLQGTIGNYREGGNIKPCSLQEVIEGKADSDIAWGIGGDDIGLLLSIADIQNTARFFLKHGHGPTMIDVFKTRLRGERRIKENVDYAMTSKYGYHFLLCDHNFQNTVIEIAKECGVVFATVHVYNTRQVS